MISEVQVMEMYWVGSNGEDLEKIYFNSVAAMNSEHRYLDSFDAHGNHLNSYKLVDDWYTTDW